MLVSAVIESVPNSIRILHKFVIESLAGSITLQQFRTMKLILEGYGSTQIAEMLSVSMAAISKMISSLEAKNLITKTQGSDRRSQVLKLTPQGKKILGQVKKQVEKKLQVGISQLGPAEQITLQNGLEALNKLMSLVKEG
jgi:DNA-binding MarR family transcriptional regulator